MLVSLIRGSLPYLCLKLPSVCFWNLADQNKGLVELSFITKELFKVSFMGFLKIF